MAAEMEAERKRAEAPDENAATTGEDVSNKRLKLDVGIDDTTNEKAEEEKILPKEKPQEQSGRGNSPHKKGNRRNDGRGNSNRDRPNEDGDDQSQRLPVSVCDTCTQAVSHLFACLASETQSLHRFWVLWPADVSTSC
jgi:hypothetical protein